jgi:hypothetical protein
MSLQQDVERAAKRLVNTHYGPLFEREAAAFIAMLNSNGFMNANTIEYVRLTVQRVAIDSGLNNHNIVWHRLKRLYDI